MLPETSTQPSQEPPQIDLAQITVPLPDRTKTKSGVGPTDVAARSVEDRPGTLGVPPRAAPWSMIVHERLRIGRKPDTMSPVPSGLFAE